MTRLFEGLAFALTVTGPIVVMLVMGILLARWRIITDAFIDAGSRLVFNVLLPVLLFLIISKTRFEQTANLTLIVVGYLAGLRGMELGIVFLMASAPTAASSYPMTRAMGGNATLAANIIVLSTIASVLVTTLGMLWLSAVNLV